MSKTLDLPAVIITSGTRVNTLGVVRCFGRRNIPVIYINSKQGSIARYSRYVDYRLNLTPIHKSETEYIEQLIQFGKDADCKMMIIPTGDEEVIALARHKSELEKTFILPIPGFDIVNKFVNKTNFYKLMAQMNIPFPKTYFPNSLEELRIIGQDIGYPFIIKPSFSALFLERFNKKSFFISSNSELNQAIELLQPANLDVMLQEIIPGKEIYEFYGYLDRESIPLAVCGWNKIRHYPPDFGSGSFCKSHWRESEIETCWELLKTVGFYGFANPELKKDPRDGKYKILEINVRTTLQNRLAAACGVDVEYIAYLHAYNRWQNNQIVPANDIYWADDFVDQVSLVIELKRKEISFVDALKSLFVKRVHSVISLHDPIPVIVHLSHLIISLVKRLLGGVC